MPPDLDTAGKIKVLDLLPESSLDGGGSYKIEEYLEQDCPAYDVIEYMSVQSHDSSSSILIDGKEAALDPTLGYALSHRIHQNISQKLWVQSLCIDPMLDSKQLSRLLRRIRTKAEMIIIWIGRDHEEGDILRSYLGPGTDSSTENAFKICQSIAAVEDPEEDLRQYIIVDSPQSQRAMRCHLMNLLYRSWFRELPILKTNYLDEIPLLMVGCGARLTKWVHIKKAAERIRMIEPIPHLLEDSFLEVFESEGHIRDWLQARENFGFNTIQLISQAMWLQKQLPEGQTDTDARKKNVLGFIGKIGGLCGSDSGWHETVWQSIHSLIDKEDAREHSPITLASLKSSSPLPTLPVRQVLDPAPDPEYQAPYVHEPAKRGFINLLKLFPQDNSGETLIQGTIISFPVTDIPPFSLVGNATLKSYRRNALILIDGQSFLVPEALEVFLRRVRDPIDEQLFFIWRICLCPQDADVLGDERGVAALINYTRTLVIIASRRAASIDMYDVLTEAAEDVAHESEGVLDADDWLLDLLDEETVSDPPATEQSEEEKNIE